MEIRVSVDGAIERFADQIQKLGVTAPVVMNTALMVEAPAIERAVEGALQPQTNLKTGTIQRAVKSKHGALTLTLTSSGGNISLAYFGARETAKGVSAAPWGKRRVYAGSFIRGGRWPKRRGGVAPSHAFKRTGKARLPVKKVKSGLFIPEEMTKGASLAAFESAVATRVVSAVESALAKAMP